MRIVKAIVDGGMIGGNPGKGGWGGRFRVYSDVHECDETLIDEKFFGFSFGEEIVTNNVAEWRAVVGAMQIFIEHYWNADFYQITSDSKIIVKQANHVWQCKDEHLGRLQGIFDSLKSRLLVRQMPGILPDMKLQLSVIHMRREHTTVAHDHIAKILGRK